MFSRKQKDVQQTSSLACPAVGTDRSDFATNLAKEESEEADSAETYEKQTQAGYASIDADTVQCCPYMWNQFHRASVFCVYSLLFSQLCIKVFVPS